MHVELAEALAQRVCEQRAMAALRLVLHAQETDATFGHAHRERVDGPTRGPADVREITRSPGRRVAALPGVPVRLEIAERPIVRVLDASVLQREPEGGLREALTP